MSALPEFERVLDLPLLHHTVALWIGLCVGGLCTVIRHRLDGRVLGPLGPRAALARISHPPSTCPHCGVPLGAVDILPLVGWLLRRGRCAGCHAPISLRYPLTEATVAAVVAAAAAATVGHPWTGLLAAALGVPSATLAATARGRAAGWAAGLAALCTAAYAALLAGGA